MNNPLNESKYPRFKIDIGLSGFGLTRRVMVMLAHISIDAGDRNADTKCWIKKPTLLHPSKGGGRGIVGDFLPELNQPGKNSCRKYSVFDYEGTLLVAHAVCASGRQSTSNTLVFRLKEGGKVDLQYRHQRFVGTGVEVLKIARTDQQELQLFPELEAPRTKWSEIYAILQAAGVPLLPYRSKPQVD